MTCHRRITKHGFALLAAAAAAVVAAGTGCRMPAAGTTPGSSPGSSGALRSPIDIDARRVAMGRQMPDLDGRTLGPPIRDIEGVSYYVDDAKSVADPVLKERNLTALRPLRNFVADVVKLADGWMLSKPPHPDYAARVLDGLTTWANADALLGTVNRQGEFEREWTLGSLAWAYLKVRDAPGATHAHRIAIEPWLRALAVAVQPFYERPHLKSNQNNHAYWTGLAVATAAVACNDRALFEWGMARARIGIAQVQPDGILPLEADRQTLAFHYHVFALAPLVLLAELGTANGIALYDEGGGAIRRLAELVIGGFANPVSFADRMGLPQEIRAPPAKTDLAWAEPYHARFADTRVAAWMPAARPLYDVRLGGDMTATFARAP